MESWRRVWREGIAPQLSTPGLEALRAALVTDDKRLLQGQTTEPVPLDNVADWPVEAACPISYCFWKGDGLSFVAEVQEAFAQTTYACDAALGEPIACRWFLNWADETPREEMRRELLAEVERVLAERAGGTGL